MRRRRVKPFGGLPENSGVQFCSEYIEHNYRGGPGKLPKHSDRRFNLRKVYGGEKPSRIIVS